MGKNENVIGGVFPCLNSFLSSYCHSCLLYTSDAADDLLCVDLGGRRIIKKNIMQKIRQNFNEMGENENFIGGVFPCLNSFLSSYCHSIYQLGYYTQFCTYWRQKIFLEKKQNFECIFLKTRFLDFQTLKRRISAIFWAKKLNEVSLEREFSPLY